MLIERDQRICGVDAVVAREVVRSMRPHGLDANGVAAAAGCGLDGAREIIAALVDGGFVTASDDQPDGGRWWSTTLDGNRLGKARIGKPITRATAQRALDGLIDRVKEINAEPDSCYGVETVEVFGSFNDELRERVGDVDVRLVYRVLVSGDQLVERSGEAADASGRDLGFLERLGFLELEFKKRLRHPSLDIEFSMVGKVAPIPDSSPRLVYSRSGPGT